MRSSKRLDQIPPYLFAQLERKIAAKRAAGVDVISLGIGDPDTPTYPPIVAALQEAVIRRSHPDCDFRVIAGAGHWAMYERAEAFNATLLDMLKT